MPSGLHRRLTVVVKDHEGDAPSEDVGPAGPQGVARSIFIHYEQRSLVSAADLYAALWQAARQAWPSWMEPEDLALIERKRLEALRAAAARQAPAMPMAGGAEPSARLLARALGAPDLLLILQTDHLTEATADACIRALELLVDRLDVAVLWRVPVEAVELPGVQRVAVFPVDQGASDPSEGSEARAGRVAPRVRWDPVVGRPHPASEAEILLYRALEASTDLAGRFRYNVPVPSALGSAPIVDLLEPEAYLVVEVDGYAFHRSPRQFARDRQRDFELLVTGYRVLRLTHDEVVRDPRSAVDKIRAVLAAPRKPET